MRRYVPCYLCNMVRQLLCRPSNTEVITVGYLTDTQTDEYVVFFLSPSSYATEDCLTRRNGTKLV